jgi:hypothetical protein
MILGTIDQWRNNFCIDFPTKEEEEEEVDYCSAFDNSITFKYMSAKKISWIRYKLLVMTLTNVWLNHFRIFDFNSSVCVFPTNSRDCISCIKRSEIKSILLLSFRWSQSLAQSIWRKKFFNWTNVLNYERI